MKVSLLWVKASFRLNAQEILNGISYKSMMLFMQKEGGIEHMSGASQNIFEFRPYIMLENTHLASRKNIAFIIDLELSNGI